MNTIFELYDTHGNPIYNPVANASIFTLSAELTKKVRVALLDKPVPELRLYGVVNEEMASYVRESIMFLESKDSPPAAKVLITSPGGSVIAGLEIHSLLSFYKGSTTAFVSGYAYSAAAQLILQGCTARGADKYSHMMCHFAHTLVYVGEHDLGGKRRMTRIKEQLKMANDQAIDIIVDRTGQSEVSVRKFLSKGLVQNVQQYKDFGLIDNYYSMKTKVVTDRAGIVHHLGNIVEE
jgi:ATP-dependent Clp protease protease subunit